MDIYRAPSQESPGRLHCTNETQMHTHTHTMWHIQWYMYTHTYMYIYTHTHTHTHTNEKYFRYCNKAGTCRYRWSFSLIYQYQFTNTCLKKSTIIRKSKNIGYIMSNQCHTHTHTQSRLGYLPSSLLCKQKQTRSSLYWRKLKGLWIYSLNIF